MTDENQGPATPGTAARCETCAPDEHVDGSWHYMRATSKLSLEIERLKAENASLRESLRAAEKDYADMRRFQSLYINADHARLAAEQRAEEQFQKATRQAERAEAAEKDRDAARTQIDKDTETIARLKIGKDALTETLQWVRRLPMAKKYRDRIEATLQEAAKGRAPEAPLEAVCRLPVDEAADRRMEELRAAQPTGARAALHDEERRQRGGCPGFGVTKEQLDKALADGEKDREAMEVENSKQRPPGGKW